MRGDSPVAGLDDCCRRAPLESGLDEFMPVRVLSLYGDEQIAGLERAGYRWKRRPHSRSRGSGAPVAAEISSKVQSGSSIGCIPRRGKSGGGGLMIGKGNHHIAGNLPGFMAFSSHEQNIPLF